MSRVGERHLFVEIAAEVSGGLLVVAVYQKSLIVAAAGVLLGLTAYIIDRVSIRSEEKFERLQFVAGVMNDAASKTNI